MVVSMDTDTNPTWGYLSVDLACDGMEESP